MLRALAQSEAYSRENTHMHIHNPLSKFMFIMIVLSRRRRRVVLGFICLQNVRDKLACYYVCTITVFFLTDFPFRCTHTYKYIFTLILLFVFRFCV